MKQIFTLFFTLSLLSNVFAQTTISGSIRDNKKNALPGANIFLKDTYDGTTSDVDGNYTFTTSETGKQIFTVSFVGYENYADTITITPGNMTINVELKELFNELNAVVITAGAFEASDERKTPF
ncbi:MAG: carboxypeptidase-like regulatory domain-containing protein [Bacteroidetes bacterium]|nr:carboxypeptidase-like regulatory domain-containing protein [Bacteroidota bacterium]